MKVFKFGGASVNSVEAIKNMAHIVADHLDEPLVVVVSAMGKTTNLLERIIPGIPKSDEERKALLKQSKDYHFGIANELLDDGDETFTKLRGLFAELERVSTSNPGNYNFDYDQTVSYGELISTTLISGYLNSIGISNEWVDVRQVIRTDENYREGIVDFETTRRQAQETINSQFTINHHPRIYCGNRQRDNYHARTRGFGLQRLYPLLLPRCRQYDHLERRARLPQRRPEVLRKHSEDK